MNRILRLFRPLIKLNYKHPFWVISVSLVLAAFSGYYASKLKIDTDIANLLPPSYNSVKALDKLKETVGGETPMEVVIKSPSFQDNKRFAEALIDKSLKLYDSHTDNYYFERAEFRKDTKVLKDNALYFATEHELDDIKKYLKDEIHQAKLEANPFYFSLDDEEDSAASQNDLGRFEESYNSLIPSEYPVNADSTIMVLRFYPTGSKSNIKYLENMFAAYDSLLATMNPTAYNPNMEVKFGGRLQRHLEEFQSIMRDVTNSFASGISSVILLVMLYFFFKKYWNYRKWSEEKRKHSLWGHIIRMPVPILIIGIPLLISLLWTFGLTYWNLGTLNTMTSVLFVILFGLGIDYGIHFYARYIEIRSSGADVYEGLMRSYEGTGAAIITSAVTTASALYVLMFADFRGFSEFGFISGTGIMLALFCMLFVLPSLLVIFEKLNWILLSEREDTGTKEHVPHRFPMSRVIVIGGTVIAALVIYFHSQLTFQYEFGELEPEFPQYQEFRKMSAQVHDSDKRNPAYILADTDKEVIQILDKLREKMQQDTLSPTIADVEALQERFPPSDSAAQAKLKEIAQIRELLNDPFIKNQENEQLDKLRRASKTTKPLDVNQIPAYLKNRFVTKSGDIGRFVMVYPSVGLSDGRNSIAFKNDVGKVTLDNGKTFYAASTSIVAAEMLELMHDESPYMVTATFILIFIFMLIAFRSLKWTVIAMIPLVVGLLWTFGLMMLLGFQFNFYNLIVLPAILGIGEDNGVHLAHRYREEGKNSMWDVLSSTGQHITIGSVTTMLGFAGLLFTHHPGLKSIGELATIGIGLTLLSALTFLPSMIQWLEDKDMIHFDDQHGGHQDEEEPKLEEQPV